MKKSIFILSILFTTMTIKAQQKTFAGEYYLKGVMETASGFKLNADSTFDFFFSYGALDRYGKGKWEKKGNSIIFNSSPHSGKDFAIKKSEKTENDSITIKITDKNERLLPYVYAMLQSNNKLSEPLNNKEGIIIFPKQSADSIVLQFQFCPERNSAFSISNDRYNYFEFTIEPWLTDVFFTDFSLSIDGNNLKGAHPMMMQDKKFYYEKVK